jgi:AcrR family transcriptional regulator
MSTESVPVLDRRAPEARRRRVLDAARRRFLTDGYERTRVEQVAADAGVSIGLIYKQHPTKAHLLQAVRDDFEDRFLTALRSPAIVDAHPRDRFRPIVQTLFDTARSSPDLAGMMDLPPAGPGAAPERLHRRVAELIGDGVAAGAYRAVVPERAAVAAYGMVEAALRQALGADAGETAAAYVDLLVEAWSCWLLLEAPAT